MCYPLYMSTTLQDPAEATLAERTAKLGYNPVEVRAWLLGLGRKVTDQDLTPELHRAARQYAASYRGRFDFMVIAHKYALRGPLRTGTARGVLNCARVELLREQPVSAGAGQPEGLDLRQLPSGRYALEAADGTQLRLAIDNLSRAPEGTPWRGWVFVAQLLDHTNSNRRKAGAQGKLPQDRYQGPVEAALREILADPQAACYRYGAQTGRCGICDDRLTDPVSIARKVGPVCVKKSPSMFGKPWEVPAA
jgi:hypothetical protein